MERAQGILIALVFSGLSVGASLVVNPIERPIDPPLDVAKVNLCHLDVQKDLSPRNESQPLYLVPNSEQFWLPNGQGSLQLAAGQEIELHCQSSFKNHTRIPLLPRNTRSLRPICVGGKMFKLPGGEKVELKYLTCKRPTFYAVQLSRKSCGEFGYSQLYRVGFNISVERFIESMEICHDTGELRTQYTHHRIHPSSIHFQRFVKRPNFSKAGFFSNYNMQKLYSRKHQLNLVQHLFGREQEMLALDYFNHSALYLSRGHLAAKSDFIYSVQQYSSFQYLNVAPQWQTLNGGQWATMEDQVRIFAAKSNKDLDCFTGTWGVLLVTVPKFGTIENTKRAFYLTYDENNNGLLPVPKLFYRILIDPQQHGIVLLAVNDPHATLKDIKANYIICPEIQENLSWLKWIKNNNLRKGYMYACTVHEFAKVTNHLPIYMNEIVELLS